MHWDNLADVNRINRRVLVQSMMDNHDRLGWKSGWAVVKVSIFEVLSSRAQTDPFGCRVTEVDFCPHPHWESSCSVLSITLGSEFALVKVIRQMGLARNMMLLILFSILPFISASTYIRVMRVLDRFIPLLCSFLSFLSTGSPNRHPYFLIQITSSSPRFLIIHLRLA